MKINGGYIRQDGTYAIASHFDCLSEFQGDYAIEGRFVADGIFGMGWPIGRGTESIRSVMTKSRIWTAGILSRKMAGLSFWTKRFSKS